MRLEYFEMIDAVVALDRAAGRIEALAHVPQESPVFEGHFPGHPLVPACSSPRRWPRPRANLILAHLGFERMPFLTGCRPKARFRSFVGPGPRSP